MRKLYRANEQLDSKKLAKFLAQEGQLLLPLLDLILNTESAVDEVIDVTGRAAIEAILLLSATQVAGESHPGKKQGPLYRNGTQNGVVSLSERKLRVNKPRLRHKETGEVPIPAYEALLTNSRLGQRILEILMKGVSTRNYKEVLPAMAETVGVSKSQISREFIEVSSQALESLCDRNFVDKDILIIYLDGIQFGEIHVIAALGVDSKGYKHILGIREGASENSVVVRDLLNDLVERGIDPQRKRLFVIDGSKALRKGIHEVFGSDNPVQRCRNHKMTNVLGYLPKEQHDQVRATMKAAFQLDEKKGTARLNKLADWLEQDNPSAAESLREGLKEMFTINRLGLPARLRRCLGSTNVIESPNSGIRQKTRRVTQWQDGQMVVRWCASALLATEKKFRRIMGHEDLWILEAKLNEWGNGKTIAHQDEAA
jgi:transposase-like protein